MNQNNDAIVSAFEEYKSKGLSYYEATQKLRQAGYSDREIINAAYYIKYTETKLDEHPAGENQVLDAAFAEAASKQRRLNHLEDEMNIDMIKRNYPTGGLFWSIKSIFSWANYTSASNKIPKSKVYLAYALAIIGFDVLIYISSTILVATHLPAFLLIVFTILSFLIAHYCLARYLRSK